jgi:hypothetical protein
MKTKSVTHFGVRKGFALVLAVALVVGGFLLVPIHSYVSCDGSSAILEYAFWMIVTSIAITITFARGSAWFILPLGVLAMMAHSMFCH